MPKRAGPYRPPTVFSRWSYYLSSIPTLLFGIQNLPVLFALLKREHRSSLLILRNGTRYWVRNLMDVWIIKETNLDRQYAWYGVPVEDGWHIVDIGAGLGDFAVFAAGCSPHGSVQAYEPFPESAALLERNLEVNGIQNVRAFPYAVASEAGTLTLELKGGVAVRYSTLHQGSGSDNRRITVRSVTLPDVLALLPEGKCDLLKMDCEGAEYDILLNLDSDTLGRISRICLEFHDFVTPYSHHDLLRYLAEQGWQTYASANPVHGDIGFLYAENPKVRASVVPAVASTGPRAYTPSA